jgi:hypothetical protein
MLHCDENRERSFCGRQVRYGVKSVCGGIGFPSGAIVFVRSFDPTCLGYVIAHELGLLVAAADGANMAGPGGATPPILDGSEWTTPRETRTGFRKKSCWCQSGHHSVRDSRARHPAPMTSPRAERESAWR